MRRIALALSMPQYGHEADVIRRMQRRDDILSVLLPVLAAVLLFLLLIAMRQQRSGKMPFERLIKWLKAAKPARVEGQSSEAFAQMVEMEAEQQARRERQILSAEGTVLLYVGQRVRVHTPDGIREGAIYDIEEEDLTLASSGLAGPFDLPWAEVQRIEAEFGPPRRRRIQWILGLLGAGVLGGCGAILDGIDRSTSMSSRGQYGAAVGIVLGALLGGLFGRLIMYAMPGPRWNDLVVQPGESPLSPANFASRVENRENNLTPREEIIARAILLLLFFGMCAVFR